MSYKIAFFDIDGTLVNEEKVIPQDTIDAIAEMKEKGIEPVIATGRAPYFLQSLLEAVGIESYVCLNGALAVYKGEVIYRNPIAPSTLATLVEQSKLHGHALCFEGESQYYTDHDGHEYMLESVGSLKVELPKVNADFWKEEPIYQMFLHTLAEDEHLYTSLEDSVTFIRWHDKALDVLPIGGSKAKGIEAMLNQLNLTAEDAIAFGDNLNDKEMLEYVGFGVAMGNSHPDVIPYANFVTTHVDEKGIRNGLIKAGILNK
ncbi:Cof-type HAD-IIB family hydrolase [Paenibacillus endoradicis]|uniref:Cof-type HAD-IIB family hydrolase n=1 Tax=Paenibacillus endoradicis TaxID=2972487 RepID=UPI002158FDC3|nr:Cof-type HAD-IIB family hydrolase [Paenibacillus endoradicis]MCR8659973.1 Cof-type HAD-IIB family hydrolase [Paenibacillus endoradicis]